MFPGGQPDMSALLAQAQQMQQQLMAAQDELAHAQVQGTAGGGLVTATVSGTGELVGLQLEPGCYDPDDPDALGTLADLIVAAVRDATANAQGAAARRLGPLAGGLGGLPGLSEIPGLGGLDLGDDDADDDADDEGDDDTGSAGTALPPGATPR